MVKMIIILWIEHNLLLLKDLQRYSGDVSPL